MKKYKILNINGALLDRQQLERHLEKVAASHNLNPKSKKETYPIPRMMENFDVIQEVYYLLNEHLKLGIGIHPAGEWLLDNFYIIEETVKSIKNELTLKKYTNFVGIANGNYEGFARIYVLAAEIVAYTDNKIERDALEAYLLSYQTKKTLSMDEIWNIGIFLQIAIIENIREICERIYSSQMQKYKVENIVERLVENKDKNEITFKNNNTHKLKEIMTQDMKYPFIEYMSYILKRYGKKAYRYLNILEETVEMMGTNISDVIKKEHFDIAVRKVSIGNSITSIKKIQRINFLEIFEKINGVEELLKKDPANVYEKMDYKTKEYYRNKIKEISHKTKISEIYITNKILEIASQKEKGTKQSHIGYYLIDIGINELYDKLQYRKSRELSSKEKVRAYTLSVISFTAILSILMAVSINSVSNSTIFYIASTIIFLIPISELVIQLVQYVLGKIVKPKLIPKLDFSEGIDKENATIVVIPTILKSKEKVQELMKKLEVFYLANKSENLYFALLGDCSQSDKQEEAFDDEVINEGICQAKILNDKYKNDGKDKFYFVYRKRVWNDKEGCYLGWERKRGLLNQFNEFILRMIQDPFKANTFKEIPNIKYVITLDADTDLILNSAFELVGAMSHILNTPVIDENRNIVIQGHGIIQPRVGVNLQISCKNLFTKIFAGSGGIDSYTNAISDLYQDNFGEGIFTGKGIYDIKVFSTVMKGAIPENTVLSHDLLEGNYLRCGLASDILLMDGYPTKYISFMTRLSRWIRGDWQIIDWVKSKLSFFDEKEKVKKKIKNPLNFLSKYKIFDNLRRSVLEISFFIAFIYLLIIKFVFHQKIWMQMSVLWIIVIFPFLLELINRIIFKKEGEAKQKTFTPLISGVKGAIYRAILTLACLPYKAYISLIAIVKTIYRKTISHKHLLEWTTSEEVEKQSKTDLLSYYKQMIINPIVGLISLLIGINISSFFAILISILWVIAPIVMCIISKDERTKTAIEELNENEKQYLLEIGKKTWKYFETYLNGENNYLIPDNYQEDRKPKVIQRTSSTNIGLSLLAVISAYDLGYIELEKAIELLNKIIESVMSLQKWNGHLYNWYETKTKEPLNPKYISTVDSGNFVGYLFVTKVFLENILKQNVLGEGEKVNIENKVKDVTKMIQDTDFSVLYSKEQNIFSIGFNIEENKLTDSYYDLLASEARQASLVAIAKKDVPAKHWNFLSRTLTVLGKYKGLVSWSGTAFEYLMPNINIPKYEGSLLDESCKFMIKCQMEYAEKLNLPWGFSEAAFNLKDLHSNYQYKAFGIPWIGLKRGLADEMVVSSYGSILAISEVPKEVLKNLKVLEKEGMYEKFGFYESIDYTPERLKKGKTSSVVKTYMAHHQGLILLSINNLFNNQILQKRFIQNPEIEAVSILLQERMPENSIITKEEKEKPEKIKYKDYENYVENVYTKIDENLIRGNVISNEDYTVAFSQTGMGVSKYKDIYINRFKKTDDYSQGIFFYIKNIKSKNIWSTNYLVNENKENKHIVHFMPDRDKVERIDGSIKTKMNITIAPNEPVEIRRLELENMGNEEEILEVSSYFEPVLSEKEQDYAHPAFNNLFLVYDFDEKTNSLIVKRKNRIPGKEEIYLGINLYTECEIIGDLEYEIDKEKLIGRGDLGIPKMIQNSIPFSRKLGLVTEPIVAVKRTIRIQPKQKVILDLIISVKEDRETVIKNLEKYKNSENVRRTFELSRARVEEESRYLNLKGKEIETYQKILSYIIFDNPSKSIKMEKVPKQSYKQSELWKYGISGDFPIILVKIKDVNDSYVIEEMLKLYEFLKTKNVKIELVILDEEKHSYENYVREEINASILNYNMEYLKNVRGGIFHLTKNEISKQDVDLLNFLASIVIEASKGGIENNLKELEEEYKEKRHDIGEEDSLVIFEESQDDSIDLLKNTENLKYYNEYGAFSEDGKEYLIKVQKENRLPTVWSHIMANEKFGTVVTEDMGGYSWYKNSRLNRVSCWENSACYDIPSEVIYLKDCESKKTWSLGLNPKPDQNQYNIIYGFGYAKYIHKSDGIEQEVEVFIPKEESCKISIVKLKNTTPNRKKIKILYYMKPVLGEDEYKTNEYINLKYDENNNILYAKNLYVSDLEADIVYVSCSEKMKSYTGDKKFFLGKGYLSNPDGLKKSSLNKEDSLGKKSCIAFEVEVEIESFSDKEVSIILGSEENLLDSKNIAYKYSKIQNCNMSLTQVKNEWNEIVGTLQVNTPLESINILLNGWLPYQVISSRLNGRSGFYQSGGAFGFRDQLQDTLGLKYLNPEILRNQIIKHSRHQFIEGDVEHWWHEDNKKGIRTRFSDDLLWLAYATIEYLDFTGDESILDVETPYLKGKILEETEDEKYDTYLESDIKENIYNHCIRAIEKSLNFGENGLPKIGSGDWNDGFSTVGNKGRGESIWLGFFLYMILEKFVLICKKRGEEERSQKYEKIKNELRKALNTNGWDGRWYKRAYMDDGSALGSMENDECRIDSIAQSFSVISNAGDNDKKYISMESLENHLIDRENGIIKLFDPPFAKGKLEPGYIKGYLPGVRENGGQYTHVCCC